MRRQGWRWLLIGMLGLLITGCFAPQGPEFGDGSAVPEEASRVRLPVRPGPDGTWAVNSTQDGLLGQGRVLVRRENPDRRGWRLALPAEFAVTSRRPGSAHSALVHDHEVVLVGGREGRGGPSAIAGLDMENGHLAWRLPVTPNSQVFLNVSGAASVLLADCRSGSCHLTGVNSRTGRRMWTRTEPGAVKVLDSCRADAFAADPLSAFDHDHCRLYLVTHDRIATLDMDDGRLHGNPGIRVPRGDIDRITEGGGRITLSTAPAKGTCRATVAAGPAGNPDGAEDLAWQHTFVWDQPQAPRDPRTGCRWDRTLPLLVGYFLVLPEAGSALVLNPYFGTRGQYSRRLAPGEYLTADRKTIEIIHARGRPDRAFEETDGPIRPNGLSSAARALTGRFWQDGRRLLLLDHEDRPLWQGTSDCQAFMHQGAGPGVFLTYCDGPDLVSLRPRRRD
ncbi:hypothetical protein [Streptomyces sp. NPDC085479]|uniref:hypothetical protein n=1 Tax=Streptomyces sp. NPDC085479 TaxID=3365726 RepID=UPI0037D58C1D